MGDTGLNTITKIDYKGLRNTRDLGQFLTEDGRKVKSNILIRSGRIDKMSKKRIKRFIQEYNIKTIIDLRTQVEVNESKHFMYPQYVDYYHIPVLNQQFFGITHEINKMSKAMMEQRKKLTSSYSGEDYMIEMYKSIVFEPSSQRHFATVFDVLANKQDGALLYHCTGGKDRTGITSLFLLTLLGVSEEDILDDYESSNFFNAKYIRNREMLMKIFMPTSKRFKKLLSAMLYTKREYLSGTIEAIKEKFGSIEKFLYEKIDITPEKHEKLKKLYLE
jgi:protein-tyrosine phosphatase